MKLAFKQFIILFFSGLVLWLFALQIEMYSIRTPIVADYVKDLENTLHKSESEINAIFNNTNFLISAAIKELSVDTITKYERLKYSLLIYNDSDSLLYWNNNKVQPYKGDYQFERNSIRRIHEIAGSKYLMLKIPYEPYINEVQYRYSVIALVPLYLRFPINNSYLVNHFPLMSEDFSKYVELDSDDGKFSVSDSKGNKLIKLKAKETIPYRKFVIWAFVIYFISSIFLISGFYRISAALTLQKGFSSGFSLYILLILAFRLLTVYAEIPKAAKELPSFKTSFTIGNELWFYSLGDFLIDVGLLLWISLFLVHQLKFKRPKSLSNIIGWAYTAVVYTIIMGGIHFIQRALNLIVNNPNIYFEFEAFSKINLFSFYALFGILGLILSFFIVSNKLLRILNKKDISRKEHFIIGTLVLSFITLIGFSFHFDPLSSLFSIIFSVLYTIMLWLFNKEKVLSFVWVSCWIFFFSIMATAIMEKANNEKVFHEREDFLKKLLSERDYELEEAIASLETQISKDEFFKVYLSSPYVPYSQVLERLSYLYLDNAFFGRYQYRVNIYNASGNAKRPEHLQFDELQKILSESQKTGTKNLYFYSDPYSRYVYWAIFPLISKGNLSGTIAIELTPAPDTDESSVYVELMSNQKSKESILGNELSYALYKNNQRIFSKNGNFGSYIAFNTSLPNQEKTIQYEEYGVKYIACINERNYIGIAALPVKSYIKPFSIFSYLFCAGILSVIILFLLVWLCRIVFKFELFYIRFKVSLRERIQQGIVLVSLLSFVAIGIITIFFFRDEYSDYHKSRLERKIDSVSKTASWQLISATDSVVKIPDALELSAIHKIDVNVYTIDGNLLSSSEDPVFGRRLISRQMNPVAFFKMKNEKLNRVTLTEEINHFQYLSGYVPLKDKNDQTVAFLNLPYDFAGNQNLQSQDIAEFLGTLLNVYVIFLLLAGVVALILANSVTRPLSIIGEKLRAIQVGGKNEKIDWKSRDEDINEFINRYNYMIEQLDASTRELARTQRESAWREMARQIAHEIKNPLTPMKLQIQMLEYAAEKDAEKAKEMIKKVAKSLIQQIDILANIASEFSNFAKMPAAKNENMVLNELVESVYTLFSEEENIKIHLDITEEALIIFADREQMTRVLNNLIKNAIQAIPSDRPGRVQISLYKTAFYAVVKVSDNGVGIPEDRKDKIFTPYFTTKSSGSGIGLNMSKNIVESAKGQIYFESKEGIGTDFFVEIPLSTES